MPEEFPISLLVAADDAGKRLDQFLTSMLGVSRARVQELIAAEKVLVDESPAKASLKLRGGESVGVLGRAERPPLRAIAENIPLDIRYEDGDLAIINKPAGMMVHAGAGATGPNGEDQRNRGTLVNALLHHFASLSAVGGELRPGIVHRLDKETSGLIVVAKNDEAHRKLAAQFAQREVKKKYVALVHGRVKKDQGTISQSISRDRFRRTRMTTRGAAGREAVTHYHVIRRLDTPFGNFTLLDVKIDTGRTHQIRVHMSALGHPIVGDTLYGAPRALHRVRLRQNPDRQTSVRQTSTREASAGRAAGQRKRAQPADTTAEIAIHRNFLHSCALEFKHPRSGQKISLQSELPPELREVLARLEMKPTRPGSHEGLISETDGSD